MGDGSPIPNGTGTMQERIDRQATTVISGYCRLTDDSDFKSFHTPLSSHDDQLPIEDWDPQVFRTWVDDMITKEGVLEVLATLRSSKTMDKPKAREKSVHFDTPASSPSTTTVP